MVAHGVSRGLERKKYEPQSGERTRARQFFCRPAGAWPFHIHFPRLTPWAAV
jgi:hypothetical protein